MEVFFEKYQGTGNDFILLDNRDHRYDSLTSSNISFLCDRKFGIGADGLMLLNIHPTYPFEMVYFNADGQTSSMCGNGGRCIVHFAKQKNVFQGEKVEFIAIDGLHSAFISDEVSLQMNDVSLIQSHGDDYVLDTGSPHYVQYVDDLHDVDIVAEGKKIRYSSDFNQEGINVNFIEHLGSSIIDIATYERGVENETLSCGTGATACALVHAMLFAESTQNSIQVRTKGGSLRIKYHRVNNTFTNIWLCGPAQPVYKGQINI